MKKDRVVFWSLSGIFTISILLRIFYYFLLESNRMDVSALLDGSAELMYYNCFKWSGLADVCVHVVFLFAIVRMFKNVFPSGVVSRQWCLWIVSLFVLGMIMRIFLALTFVGTLPVSWGKMISSLTVLVSWGAPLLLSLSLMRFFKYEKSLHRRLFFLSLLLLIAVIGGPYLKSYILSFPTEGLKGVLGMFRGEVIQSGWRAVIALVELLFIWEVNRLQDSIMTRRGKS